MSVYPLLYLCDSAILGVSPSMNVIIDSRLHIAPLLPQRRRHVYRSHLTNSLFSNTTGPLQSDDSLSTVTSAFVAQNSNSNPETTYLVSMQKKCCFLLYIQRHHDETCPFAYRLPHIYEQLQIALPTSPNRGGGGLSEETSFVQYSYPTRGQRH